MPSQSPAKPMLSAADKALLLAARDGDFAALAQSLAKGARPGALGPDGRTPLALAASSGSAACAEALLAAGADPAQRDANNATAIYHAICAGHPEPIALLLRTCGEPGPRAGPGALSTYAKLAGRSELAEWLDVHWGSFGAPGSRLAPPPRSSADAPSPTAAQTGKTAQAGKTGKTAQAGKTGKPKKSNAKKGNANAPAETAPPAPNFGLFDAARNGDLAALALSLANGARHDELAPDGRTALALAAASGSAACAEALLAAGADPAQRDANNATAIYHAVCSGHPEPIALLLRTCRELAPPGGPGSLSCYARLSGHPKLAGWLEAHWESLVLGGESAAAAKGSAPRMRL